MATEMNFWTRLQSESPAFFVKIQNYAIWLGVVSTSVWGALKGIHAAIPSFEPPPVATTIYSYIMVIAAVAGIIAKTPMKDPAPGEVPKFQTPAAPNDVSITHSA